MNEVYGLVLFNKLRFVKRAIGSSNRPDSGAFPCGRWGFGWRCRGGWNAGWGGVSPEGVGLLQADLSHWRMTTCSTVGVFSGRPMYGLANDRSTFKSGCSAIIDRAPAPNDRLGQGKLALSIHSVCRIGNIRQIAAVVRH